MENIAPHPGKPIFYWTAMLLAIASIFLYGTAHNLIMQSMARESSRLHQVVQEHIPYVRDAEANRLSHAIDTSYKAGWACTGGGIVCMAIAGARQEKGWYLILFGLLMLGFMSSLLL